MFHVFYLYGPRFQVPLAERSRVKLCKMKEVCTITIYELGIEFTESEAEGADL